MESSLSLVVPIYNEEENLSTLIAEMEEYFTSFEKKYEIIFVDDGSSDNSAHIIKEDENVELIQHKYNQGYGEALKTGFEAANNDIIAYIDGDGQLDIIDLDKLLELITDNDVLIGKRANRKDTKDRIIISKGFNTIIRGIFGLNFKDINCGLKVFRSSIFDEINLSTKRTVDAELVAKAHHNDFKIEQVAVRHYGREGGQSEAEGLLGVRLDLILTTLREIIQIKRDISYGR